MKKFTSFFAALVIAGMAFAQVPKTIAVKPFHMSPSVTENDYIKGNIVFRLKEQYRSSARVDGIDIPQFNQLLANYGAPAVNKIYPKVLPPMEKYNQYGQPLVDLSLIYLVKYTTGDNIEDVCNKLLKLGIFEWAEPKYLPHTTLTPNDPSFNLQTYMTPIQATCGWGFSNGNASIHLGITDTGTNFSHPDLGNYATNPGEIQNNGLDDDNNGFIDDYRGYDLGQSMPDPQYTNAGANADGHGTNTTGLMSATTNNNTGVAGIGWNCKYVHAKISDANAALTMAYEGIQYCADMNCKVISCSWGGAGGGSYGQTIIDYATNNKDALVVAAAGNNNNNQDFYPATYDKVLSVAATQNNDVKASFSNYGFNVDVCAPGVNTYNTYNGGYSSLSGTSMATPIVSGLIGLVRTLYPSYNALQAGERVKTTCDNIYGVNAAYANPNQLGNGRINMCNALSVALSEDMVMTSRSITDKNDDAFKVGDTLRIYGAHTDFLAPTTGACTATLSSTSPYIQIQGGSYAIGALATLGVKNQPLASAFTAKIIGAPPVNTVATFKITYTDGSYTQSYWFSVLINVDYVNITVNDVWSTATSKGRIGYNDDGQTNGLGFIYQLMVPTPATLMYESSLMIGVSATKVSDEFRGGATGDVDFTAVQNVVKVTPTQLAANHETKARFNDNGAAPNQINGNNGLTVNHRTYAWIQAGYRKFIIWEFGIKNSGSSTINNLYAGIITDWDIQNYATNKTNQDLSRKMGYGYQTVGSPAYYAGTKLLTSGPFLTYGVDNIAGGGGGVDPTAGTPAFDTGEKFTVLSTSRPQAGVTGNGNDIMDCVSSGPFSILVGDSVVVAFALLAGDNLADLQTSADNAQTAYSGALTSVLLNQINSQVGLSNCYPNPASTSFDVKFHLPEGAKVELNVYNMMGQMVGTIANGEYASGDHIMTYDVTKLPEGMYYYQLRTGDTKLTRKFIVAR